MTKKNLLILSNIFLNPKTSKIIWNNKSKVKNLEHEIYVPEIYLDKKATAFYLPMQNKNLTFETLWNFVQKDHNSNVFLFSYNNQTLPKDIKIKKPLKDLAYINLKDFKSKMTHENFFNLYWKESLLIAKNTLNKETNDVFSPKFITSVKNYFFPKIYFFTTKLQAICKEYDRLLILFQKKYILKTKQKNNLEALIKDAYSWIKNYETEISNIFIEFFKEFNIDNYKVQEMLVTNQNALMQLDIMQNSKDVYWSKKIYSQTLLKVYNQFKLKDLVYELKYLQKHKELLQKKNQAFLNSIILKTKYKLKLIKKEIKVNKKDFNKLYDLYKSKYLLKKILWFWYKHQDLFWYLDDDIIFDLENHINQEAVIFFEKYNLNLEFKNRLLPKELITLKRIIKYEFHIPYTSFYNLSNENLNNLNNSIAALERYKLEVLKTTLNKTAETNEKYNNHILHLSKQIKFNQAELAWNYHKEEELFKATLENKELKLARSLNNLKIYKKIPSKFYKTFYKFLSKRPVPDEMKKYFNEINSLKYALYLVEFGFDYIDKLSKFFASQTTPKESFKQKYLAILNFIKVYKLLSLSLSDFFTPWNKLDDLTIFKLQIGFYSLKNLKVIFVRDEVMQINQAFKVEINRILVNLSKVYNFNYVFISSDFEFLKNYYSEIYIFNDYKLLEMGNTQDILTNPINPIVKTLCLGYEQTFNFNYNSLITHNFIHINQDNYHYIFAKWSEFIAWTYFSKPEANEATIEDYELSFYSFLNNLEFAIDYYENLPSLYNLENNRKLLKDYWNWLTKTKEDNFNNLDHEHNF